jgi:hypothetical protein
VDNPDLLVLLCLVLPVAIMAIVALLDAARRYKRG